MAYTNEHKKAGELDYWATQKDIEGSLKNTWFEFFYTSHFGLTRDDYCDKRVLDIGCGPRGSLEWATMARERVGVDPLAGDYLIFGASEHAMTYVATGAESIPYPDGYFHIVCSLNSLDHLNDMKAAITEMKRLTAVGGLLLLLTDVHERPTPQEPICFDWNVVDLFAPELAIQSLRCFEKFDTGLYESIEQGVMFNHADQESRYGVLSARFVRIDTTRASSKHRIFRKIKRRILGKIRPGIFRKVGYRIFHKIRPRILQKIVHGIFLKLRHISRKISRR